MEWFVHFGEQINNSGADALMAFNFAFSAAVLGVGDEMIFDRDAITPAGVARRGQRRTPGDRSAAGLHGPQMVLSAPNRRHGRCRSDPGLFVRREVKCRCHGDRC